MHGEKPDSTTNSMAAGTSAEAKRRVARRRFLARSGAAGSGMLIVTLYHQRGFGKDHPAKKIILSSPEACQSLGGQPKTVHNVKDSLGNRIRDAVECDNIPG